MELIKMATKPQCFAYSKTGSRCEKAAGHTGDHAVNMTWPDSECYVPGTKMAPPPVTAGQYLYENPKTEVTLSEHGFEIKKSTPKPPSDDPCAACGHRHKAGECKCGCHTHIG